MKRLLKPTDQRGMLLLVFLIMIPFLILIATYYMKLTLTSFQVARFDQLHTEAQLAADAGADYAVEQIVQTNSWSGTGGEVTLHSDSSIKTTYSVSTVSSSTNRKTIAVVGRTYWPANTTTAARSVTVYVDLRPVTSGSFSIIGGEGGLIMSNSSKIVGGRVFINGGISMQNNSQIGLSTNPLVVQVADQLCPVPADSTYPRVCNVGEGGQPINIQNPALIYGTVTATNQTNGSRMNSPGLVAGTVAPQPLPTYDRAGQKAAVTNNITAADANCPSGSSTTTWQANTKIAGNVTLSNSCQVTVMGNVWITGNLTLTQSAQLIVSNTLSTTQPIIMVDGPSGASFQNTATLVTNNVNTGFEIISFWSAAGCSPDCSSVTGTDLYNSRNVTTISIQNNGDAPQSIFYAYWSQVNVGNSGQIGALLGQTINLGNNGTLTFGSSVGTDDTAWVVKSYRRHY